MEENEGELDELEKIASLRLQLEECRQRRLVLSHTQENRRVALAAAQEALFHAERDEIDAALSQISAEGGGTQRYSEADITSEKDERARSEIDEVLARKKWERQQQARMPAC